jgi:hypothetical protein
MDLPDYSEYLEIKSVSLYETRRLRRRRRGGEREDIERKKVEKFSEKETNTKM